MSDADDQMGGSGGDNGPAPRDAVPGRDNAAPVQDPEPADRSEDDEDTEESFPASDPPGNY